MTDEMTRLPNAPLFDGEDAESDLFSPSPDPGESEGKEEVGGWEPIVEKQKDETTEAPEPADQPPSDDATEEVAPGESAPVDDAPEKTAPAAPAFDWNERDPLDEDELFGQIGLPDADSSPEDTDLFANDGPDALLPDEGFSESPEVTPSPAPESDGANDGANAPPPPKKENRELSERDIESRKKYAIQRIGAARVRFCCSIVFTLMLLLLESFSVFGFDVTVPLGISRVPGAAAMLDLQLILLVTYCAWRSLADGLRSLLAKRFRAEMLLVLAIVAVVWFDLDAFFRAGKGATFAALPLAVALTAATWAELLEWETRYRTLCLLQNRGVKYAAVNRGDEDDERLVLAPVRYVDGYDYEIYSYREDAGFQLLLAFLSIGVAVGGFLTAYLPTRAEIAPAFSVAISVLLLSCPFASLISRRIWFNALSSAFLDGGTAVIGEDAAYRYAHVTTFSVEDGDAFSFEETRIRIVNVFRDSRLDEILRLLSTVYAKLGGPLSRVLAETASDGIQNDAEITEIVSGGVTARVEGKTVTLGSGEYLARNGYSLPEVDVDKVLKNDRMCVLFVAYDGEVRARFYIEYVLSRAFETRAEKLRKLGVSTEIRTFDPCLTPAYFSRISYLPDEAVKIKRMGVSDVDGEKIRRAESGLFALGSLATMLDALHAFRRYTFARGWLGFCKLVQFLLGAGCAAFFLIRFPNTPIPAWASGLYCLVLILLSVLRASKSGKRISSGMRSARNQERK
ncbi:MAG: hypothetical protein J5958_05015 [Clostridia bacterium]|nr:hypothetical protein [Clostridia bacterium]